jgi:hypothetical protein
MSPWSRPKQKSEADRNRTRRYEEDNTMTSLYVWKANGATVCRFHRTPSDWDYEPLSAIETQELARMLQAEDLARVSPCEPCEMGYGGKRPGGPLTFAEAVLTA